MNSFIGFLFIFGATTCIIGQTTGLPCYVCTYSNHTGTDVGTASCISDPDPTKWADCSSNWCVTNIEIKNTNNAVLQTYWVERKCKSAPPTTAENENNCIEINDPVFHQYTSTCACNYDRCNGAILMIPSTTLRNDATTVKLGVFSLLIVFGLFLVL